MTINQIDIKLGKLVVLQYALKVYQSSIKLRYELAFYKDFCKMCKKYNLSPLSLLNTERKRNKDYKPNFEGSYFTIALGQIWYMKC